MRFGARSRGSGLSSLCLQGACPEAKANAPGLSRRSLTRFPPWQMQTRPRRGAGFAFPSFPVSDLALCPVRWVTGAKKRPQQTRLCGPGWGCSCPCVPEHIDIKPRNQRWGPAPSSGSAMHSFPKQEICTAHPTAGKTRRLE